MMRPYHQVLTLLIFLISLGLTSCKTGKPLTLSCGMDKQSTLANLSSPLNISIYVDGTPSMQGYVTSLKGEPTRYSQTIDLLQSLLIQNTPRKEPNNAIYYRLGEKPEKIERDQYIDAKKPKFYNGEGYKQFTTAKIESAINNAQENNLTVIITDLYQASEDVNKITETIQKNYLNTNVIESDYAVGIWAIKSQFDGYVYLEDGSGGKFRYTSNNNQDSKDLRPFYIILLGKYSDIDFYFRKISEDERNLENSKLNIFSAKHFVKELAHVDGEPTVPTPQKSSVQEIETEELRNPVIEVKQVDQGKIHFFRVKSTLDLVNSTSEPKIPINYSVPLKLSSQSLPLFNKNIITETKVKKFDNLVKDLQEEPKDPQLEKSLIIDQWQADSNNLNFVTTIFPKNLQHPGFYYFTVDAKVQRIEAEKWWSEWSSNNNRTQDWRTYNLERFLKVLQVTTNTLIEKEPPVIGRFCYGIAVE